MVSRLSGALDALRSDASFRAAAVRAAERIAAARPTDVVGEALEHVRR